MPLGCKERTTKDKLKKSHLPKSDLAFLHIFLVRLLFLLDLDLDLDRIEGAFAFAALVRHAILQL